MPQDNEETRIRFIQNDLSLVYSLTAQQTDVSF